MIVLVCVQFGCGISFPSGCDECTIYRVNPISKIYRYESRNFSLSLDFGDLYKEGEIFKTRSRWKVNDKNGRLLCAASSQIYSSFESKGSPGSGRLDDRIWVHDSPKSALIVITEYNSGWYERGTKTIVFEMADGIWRSTTILIPGPDFVAEGRGGFVHSVDSCGNITYRHPSWGRGKKYERDYMTHHYSGFEVIEPFPVGNNW